MVYVAPALRSVRDSVSPEMPVLLQVAPPSLVHHQFPLCPPRVRVAVVRVTVSALRYTDFGVPLPSSDQAPSLPPTTAATRTWYSVLLVSPVIVCAVPVAVAWRLLPYCWLLVLHCTL